MILNNHSVHVDIMNKNTHTQCVFHIIRLRLIIFHTPKYFHGRNIIEHISTHNYIDNYTCTLKDVNFNEFLIYEGFQHVYTHPF